MKDYTENRKFLDRVTEKLRELGIDVYVVITGEGADPIPLKCFGVDTVGASAYVIAATGERLAMTSSIDSHDVEESGLYDALEVYTDYYKDLAAMVKRFPHSHIALNFSESVPLCDGLTMGKHTQFVRAMGEDFTEYSSDLFIPAVQAMGN